MQTPATRALTPLLFTSALALFPLSRHYLQDTVHLQGSAWPLFLFQRLTSL